MRRRVLAGGLTLALTGTVLLATTIHGGHPAGAATGPMPPPAPLASVPGSIGVPAPARLLDTRSGTGGVPGPVAANTWVAFPVLGQGGVPASNVSSVWLTVTAVTPSKGGTIRVRPGGSTSSGNTVISFVAGLTAANLVLAQVGANGKVELMNMSAGPVQLVADLAGYTPAGTTTAPGAVHPLAPARLLDTRNGTGGVAGPIASHASVAMHATGTGGVPANNVVAVLVNITAVLPTASGALTAWPAGTARPGVSQVSFGTNQGLGNLVLVRVGTNGVVDIYNNSAGRVYGVVDVFGYVLGGNPVAAGVVSTVTPARVLDTRSGNGAPTGAVAPGGSVTVQLAGRGGLPATNVAAAILTVTPVSPTTSGSLIVWGDGQARPNVASVNHAAGQNAANLVIAPVGADGKVTFLNNSAGTTHIVADVAGFVRGDPHTLVSSTSRYVRNLTGAASDVSTMHSEGCTDAQAVGSGTEHVQLLDIGGQNTVGGGYGVQLTAVSTTLTDAQVVAAVNGYVDGYASCRTGTDPVYVAIATNNDGSLRDDAAGTDWADNVVDPVAAHAAGYAGVMVAGANDIEPDFTGTEPEAEAWTNAFLAATSAPYIFIGAASGCPTTGVGGDCNWSWTQQNFYNLAHGLSPSRILALPQVYYPENGAQWRYISQSGASGADRISFLGALSEYAACRTAGSGCPAGYLTAAASWQALRDALSANAAVSVQRLPVSTDLRIDSVPGASTTAKRVTTAGVQ